MMKFQTAVYLASLLSLGTSYLILEECNKECHDCYIEFSGDNLENPVDSFEGGPKACQALCAETPGCKYFTWRNAGTCLLKTKIGNKNPNLNAISGDAIDKCASVDGGWSEWSEWEVCPETCGALHHISRTRTCDNPAPKYGGTHCNADGSVDVETKPCPIHGAWGEWSNWETCSASCDGGEQIRKRHCDSPLPQHGGNDCTVDGSSDTDSQECNTDRCPVCVYEGTEYTGQNYKGQNPYKVDTFDDCYEDFISTNKKDKTCRFFTFRAFLGGDAGTCQLKHWRGNANPNKDAISGTTKC